MATKRVLMHTDQSGRCTVEADGFTGGTCLDATAAFEGLFSKQEAPREMVGECAGDSRDMGERVR
jgi:hypothetical protein